jgi:hypothetical protein
MKLFTPISVAADDRKRFDELRQRIIDRLGRDVKNFELFKAMVSTMEKIVDGEDNDAVVAATWAALTGEAGE